jgi:hypothetical protein
MPKFVHITEFRKKLETLGWKPGSLVKIKDNKESQYFWKSAPRQAVVHHLTDADENPTTEFLSGQNGAHIIPASKPIMFLGFRTIDAVGRGDYKKQKEEYYALQFLDNEQVVFWDYQALNGTTESLEEIFDVITTRDKHAPQKT